MQFQLFDTPKSDPLVNLLPKDGEVNYFSSIINEKQCFDLLNTLLATLNWEADQLFMFGQKITTLRKIAWVADQGCSYTYSGVKKNPQPWTSELLFIKNRIEEIALCEFNSCLLNLYHNGNEAMGWHSDDEIELDSKAPIASLSLGSTRKFAFRHQQDKTSTSIFLENGSLLLMKPPTQKFWNHSLLKTKTVITPRVNLTFRKIVLNP